MRRLLDVNLLVALLDQSHPLHVRAANWFIGLDLNDTLLTSPITEIGFVRVLMIRTKPTPVSIATAQSLLAAFKKASRVPVEFQPDDLGAESMPAYVKTHSQTTDGHLLALAKLHSAKLTTLDAGIPGAELVA